MKKKVLKRVLSILLCVCVFCCSFTVTAFADISLSDVMDTQYSNWSELPDDFKALGEAYVKTFTQSDNLNSMFKNASEVPISWYKVLKDGTPVLSPVSKIFYIIDEFGDLWVEDHHSDGGRHRTGGSVVVPSDNFKDFINTSGTQFSPKNATGKMSYRTDSRWRNKYPNATYYTYMSVYDPLTKFTAVGGDEMYFVFFYKTAEDTYYSATQYHFTITETEEWFEDRDEISGYNYTVTAEYWDMIDGLSTNRSELVFYNYSGNFVDVNTTKIENAAYNCFDMRHYGSCFCFNGKTKYSDYINYIDGSIVDSYYPYRFLQPSKIMYRSDMTTTIDLAESLFTKFDGSDGVSDIGYIASTTPIETIYRIDTSKIPDNYYITVNGDTVYDYSITNPETGQTDTVNNYITNNYTYITNNNGGGSGDNTGGNGSGGNITVGGKVEVGGSVGVDINVNVPDININVSGGNVGGGDNLGDYIDASGATTDIGGVISKIPELSKGFTDYLKGFFVWLPPEIYGLVVLLLVVTIWRVATKR